MRPGKPRGFTLIEVTVVLVILALVAGLVLVRGPQHSGTIDLRQASTQVAGTLRLARSRAIASNRPVPVQFDAAAASMRIGDDTPRTLPRGIALAGGPRVILFRPDGSSTGGAIALAGSARTAQVDVSWLTGRVSVTGLP